MVTLKEAQRRQKFDLVICIILLPIAIIGLVAFWLSIELFGGIAWLALCTSVIFLLLIGDQVKINQIRIAELEKQCRTIPKLDLDKPNITIKGQGNNAELYKNKEKS